MSKLPPRCEKTGKRRYKNQRMGLQAATRLWAKQPGEAIGDIHSWKCEACGGWHVGHFSKYSQPVKV